MENEEFVVYPVTVYLFSIYVSEHSKTIGPQGFTE